MAERPPDEIPGVAEPGDDRTDLAVERQADVDEVRVRRQRLAPQRTDALLEHAPAVGRLGDAFLEQLRVRDHDPPTGNPLVKPAATFAAPWLINSRSASQRSRSCAAYVRAMAAGSANPTSASTTPGPSNAGRSRHGRSHVIGGRPAAVEPTTGAA